MAKLNYPPEVRAILQSLDDPEKLLCAVLDQALRQTRAVRGLVFDRQQIIRAVGYDMQMDKMIAWRALDGLLTECYGVVLSSDPFFDGELGDRGAWSAPVRWISAAGVLVGPPGNLAVVAIEKESPLTEDEVAGFEEWLQLASMPAAVSLSNERLGRMQRRVPLKLRDLPLSELEVLPKLQEIQMMLIADAMRRADNNKGKAAAALGISREGLRRKLLRESDGSA